MLPIKSFRLVNMKIPDKFYDVHMRNDYYELNSENTLLTLANGGGKSSLILILSQVFLPNKARGSRKLIDYVADEGYSVIAVELNQGNALTTLGLVARRKVYGDTTENETEVLEYFLFISDYQGNQTVGCDPKTLPFYTDTTCRHQKSYDDLLAYLKSKPDTFKVYTQKQRAMYLKQLEDRFHNIKTWADTVWNINRSENGVSSRFKKSTEGDELISTREVIREHLIPMIESKNQIDMGEHRNQLMSIGTMYASQFESQLRRDYLSQVKERFETTFLAQTENMPKLTQALNQSYTAYQEQLELLAPLIDFKASQLKDKTTIQSKVEYEAAINKISKASLKLIRAQSNETTCLERKEQLASQAQTIFEDKQSAEEKLKIQQASKQYEDFQQVDHELQLKKQEIEMKQLANHEKGLLIHELEQSLASLTFSLYHTKKEALKLSEQSLAEHLKQKTGLGTKVQDHQGRLAELNYQASQLAQKLQTLKASSEEQRRQLGENLPDLAYYEQEVQDKKEELMEYREYLHEVLAQTESDLTGAEELASTQAHQLAMVQSQVEQAETYLEKLSQERRQLLFEWSRLSGTEPLFTMSDQEVSYQINEACQTLEKDIQRLLDEKVLVQQQLSKRRDVVIPDEVLNWLEQEQIPYQQGVDVLSDLESADRQAEWLVRYPMMPHSLVLENATDLERLVQCPVAQLEDLLLLFMVHPERYLGDIGGYWRAVGSYHPEMLNPQFWEHRRLELETKDFELTEQIATCRQSILTYQTLQSRLMTYSVKEIQAQEQQLDTLFAKQTKLQSEVDLQKAIVNELKDLRHSKVKELELLTTQIEDQQALLTRIERLQALEGEKLDTQAEEETIRQRIALETSLFEQVKDELNRLEQTIARVQSEQQQLIREEDRAAQQYQLYEAFYSSTFVPTRFQHHTIDVLEDHLDQLKRETDLSSLSQELQRIQVRWLKEKEEFEDCQVSAEICQQFPYNRPEAEFLNSEILRLQNESLRLQNELGTAQSRLESAMERTESAKKQKKEAFDAFAKQYPTPLMELEEYRAFLVQLKPVMTAPDSAKELYQQLTKQSEFYSTQLNVLKTEIESLKAEMNQLHQARAIQTQANHFDLTLLDQPVTHYSLNLITLENYLSELETVQHQYELQQNLLKDAVRGWNAAYLQAWKLSEAHLSSIPVGSQKFKETHPSVTFGNYQAVIEGMEILCRHLKQSIENESERLKEADRQRQSFGESLALRCQEVYEQLRTFDRGLKISMDGKDQQILTLKIALGVSEAEFESAIQWYITEYIKDLAYLIQHRNLAHASEMKDYERRIEKKRDDFKLGTILAQVIDFERCELRVLKMGHLDYALDLWEHDNSGGQGSLKALILVFAIFKYLNERKQGTLILLDNPFGNMSKKSLVDVMFKAAERLNITLICLTGIEEGHIQQRFKIQYKLEHNPTKNKKVVMAVQNLSHSNSERGSVELEHAFYFEDKRPSREALLKEIEQQQLF